MTIRREFVYTYDLEGVQSGVVAEFIDFTYDTRLDAAEELTFIVPGDHSHNDLIIEDSEVRWRGKRFYVTKPETKRDGARIALTVPCVALWNRLTDALLVGVTQISDMLPEDGAQALLDAAVGPTDGWTISPEPTAHTDVFSYEATDVTLLAALRQWAALTGTHLRFNTDTKEILFAASSGRERGVGFRYGRNVTQVKRTSIPPQFTRLYAYGADGLTIAGVAAAEYVQDLTWYTGMGVPGATAELLYIKARVWNDGSIVDEDTLYARAVALLATGSQGTLAYEMTVADLSEFIGVQEPFEPGDTVRVADTPLGVDVRTTLTRRMEKPLKPADSKVELSYLTPTAPAITQGASSGGGAKEWLLFGKNNGGTYQLRSDALFTTNRIGLRFRAGGEATFHHQLRFTGVSTGSLGVSAMDADTGELLCTPHSIAYTDAQVQHAVLLSSWLQEIEGQKDYRIRVKTTATGGASSSKGVNIAEGDSKFHIFAYGAVRQTSLPTTSIRYDYTGTIQTFTVPDGVTEITIECAGANGTTHFGGSGGGAPGGIITGTFAVTGGQVYDVRVGGAATVFGGGTRGFSGENGGTGGDYSCVVLNGSALTSSLIVGGGGGGRESGQSGGEGGWPNGGDGQGGGSTVGLGGTQSAGGRRGADSSGFTIFPSTDGASFAGGSGGGSGGGLDEAGSGGGGGYYGGGGGGVQNGSAQPGGGGSSYFHPSATDVEFNNGANAALGYVIISWVPVD